MKKYLIYKRRINEFENVGETVRIIEKTAASHIHLLKKQVNILSDYKKDVGTVLKRLSKFWQGKKHPLLEKRGAGIKAILIITGDKGIVGGLYHNLINRILERKNYYQKIWVLGKKGMEYLNEENIKAELLPFESDGLINPDKIEEMGTIFFNYFQNNNPQSVDILYPRFISLTKQEPIIANFLPFDFKGASENEEDEFIKSGPEDNEGFPIFEPSKKDIFSPLLKKYISIFLIELALETKLSEFSARTITAEHAVSVTKDIVRDLNLKFLKERRKLLTQKQLESFIAHQTI